MTNNASQPCKLRLLFSDLLYRDYRLSIAIWKIMLFNNEQYVHVKVILIDQCRFAIDRKPMFSGPRNLEG